MFLLWGFKETLTRLQKGCFNSAKCILVLQISFPVCSDTRYQPQWTHQRLGHHHLNLLLSQHSKLSKQALYDKLPGLQLGVNGDAWHGGDVLFLPREGRHWGGGTASAHAATDWCRSCRKKMGNSTVGFKGGWVKTWRGHLISSLAERAVSRSTSN